MSSYDAQRPRNSKSKQNSHLPELSHLFLYKNVTLIFIIHSFSYCWVKDRKTYLSRGGLENLILEIKDRKSGRRNKNEGRKKEKKKKVYFNEDIYFYIVLLIENILL